MPLALTLKVEDFKYHQPFRISGHVFDRSTVLVAELSDGRHVGRGEGAGVYYLNDDVEHMLDQASGAKEVIEAGITRLELQDLLPAGGARCAIDCAFWDLEAKQKGVPVWKLAGLDVPQPLLSTLTLSADEPDAMVAAALRLDPDAPIKVKLTGNLEQDVLRVRALRKARPDAWIGVDANQGYDLQTLIEIIPVMVDNNIALLEQPLRMDRDEDLDGLKRPLPFAADESALTLQDLPGLVGRYDIVNIKLDKCGGLTEGLAIARDARACGLKVMVGNMMGSSLSMAPSFLVGQLCDVVDLDGPTFLKNDRSPGAVYDHGMIYCDETVWGHPK